MMPIVAAVGHKQLLMAQVLKSCELSSRNMAQQDSPVAPMSGRDSTTSPLHTYLLIISTHFETLSQFQTN